MKFKLICCLSGPEKAPDWIGHFMADSEDAAYREGQLVLAAARREQSTATVCLVNEESGVVKQVLLP